MTGRGTRNVPPNLKSEDPVLKRYYGDKIRILTKSGGSHRQWWSKSEPSERAGVFSDAQDINSKKPSPVGRLSRRKKGRKGGIFAPRKT